MLGTINYNKVDPVI